MGLDSLNAASRHLEDPEYKQERITENIIRVTTPAGIFRIIGGKHYIEQNPEDLGNNYWGAVFENAYNEELRNDHPVGYEGGIQNAKTLEKVWEDKKPLFFVDTNSADNPLYLALPIVEMGMTALVGTYLLKNRGNQEGITRRNFLKAIAAVPLAYSTTDLLSMSSSAITSLVGEREMADVISHSRESFSIFDIALVKLRNLIAAEKMEEIAKGFQSVTKGKELAAIYGHAHSLGLAESLKMGHDSRMKELARTVSMLPLPFSKPEDFARVVMFEPADKGGTPIPHWKPVGQYLNKDILKIFSHKRP